MYKLYKRSPRELNKSAYSLAKEQVVRLSALEHDRHFSELEGKVDVDAIKLSFGEEYQGAGVCSRCRFVIDDEIL